ncbi:MULTISPECIES: nuclear transport factor 2 family protein [Acinetobacter]|uniref:Nuclear transport factor 2 family protein n=1 Tax=Acinetobacter piscicola TaxID=2006115 RepID=A0A4Q4H2U0_9GAMM|nr:MULTISPECIES: nuclear transport factor 2 family protein [Acinetobacter]MDM1757420.1 nuclear transport factor 2 family protein [Acinetobacter sp. 256-1]MDM1761432.1 nuclear transport factor 2 family protein [Acinetobacter sp. 251-1]QOW46677.1 nuclear transport factor 2 family protein [Acinetobacter piscicola]RYL27561.1 nuclear transport factor 2 family protein [Acinetobacter piscicola]
MNEMNLTAILARLNQLEAETAIRNCINRYMEICDGLDASTDLNELMDLFDQNSIWEGIGEKYAKSFGRYESWQDIYAMFKSYTQQQSHFVMNAHFVSSEQIYVVEQRARASWLMLQTSTFRDGQSHLNAAKLTIKFQQQEDGTWKIKHFQTENIFSRPISHWNSTAELPVPNQNEA